MQQAVNPMQPQVQPSHAFGAVSAPHPFTGATPGMRPPVSAPYLGPGGMRPPVSAPYLGPGGMQPPVSAPYLGQPPKGALHPQLLQAAQRAGMPGGK
jgi:hypothetical protein